jgi:hypothetical protein
MSQKEVNIVQEIFNNAKKLGICGRYKMALERTLEAIKQGSSKTAIEEQENFVEERAFRIRQQQKKKTKAGKKKNERRKK